MKDESEGRQGTFGSMEWKESISLPGRKKEFQLPAVSCLPAAPKGKWILIPMSVQDEIKARRILGHWRGANEEHIRSDLKRVSNEGSGSKDQRIRLTLKANWN